VDEWYGWRAKTDDNWKASDDYGLAFRAALRLSNNADSSGVLAVSILKRKVNVAVCFHFCINDAPRKRIPFFLGLAASICTRRSHSNPQWGGRNW
jgi:hypothetical protein